MANEIELTELAALGEAMLTPAGATRATAVLQAKHFTSPLHARIFDAIAYLQSQGASTDPVTVCGFLHDSAELEAAGSFDFLDEAIALAAGADDDDYITDVAVAAFARELNRGQ